MFEKNDLVLTEKEYDIPELMFQGEKLKIVEFPMRPFFESDGANIEFIHKSIYEYFVSEYILDNISDVIDNSVEKIAGVFGNLFKLNIISNEILEYLKFKISNEFDDKFDCIRLSFLLMLKDGMTYYSGVCYYNVINCEMNIFANMLEILHLWENQYLKFDNSISEYLRYNKKTGLNLSAVDLAEVNLEEVYLVNADLRDANLFRTKLVRANLRGADLRGADLRETCLVKADLRKTYLTEAILIETNLRAVDLRAADLRGIIFESVIWERAIFDESQVAYLIQEYNFNELQKVKVYIKTTSEIIGYEKYLIYIISRLNNSESLNHLSGSVK